MKKWFAQEILVLFGFASVAAIFIFMNNEYSGPLFIWTILLYPCYIFLRIIVWAARTVRDD